jgi:uncharacterized protein YyaL (SSP411 family)
MLRIRDEQMQAFDADAQKRFEDRAIRHLRANLPRQTEHFSDDNLRARVRTGAVRAREYGLESEQQIMCFVDTTFLLANNFDTAPAFSWARTILTDPQLTANQRAGTLLAAAERNSGHGQPTPAPPAEANRG